ncbi:hypothetical protein DFJ63DRAFT_334514 [Scheffersomyces coipomensis]|uniref:uncharacterized protein n=1 Tax=Scheffersomyces coipomensis TaxID=1788519 RepID=UPI00315D3024
MKLPPSPPFINRLIVGTIAMAAGIYVTMDAGKDFEFIKYVPHSPEEVERRKRENIGLSLKYMETSTLKYTPEAEERFKKLVDEKQKLEDEKKQSTTNSQ